MNATPRTLIIDASAESRELLATLLQRDGVQTHGAGSVDAALFLLRSEALDLIVIDADGETPLRIGRLTSLAARTNVPIVVVGTNRPPQPLLAAVPFVRKPYRYESLLLRIRESLDGRTVAGPRAAA